MMQRTSETPLQQIEQILETYSPSTDVILSCSSGGRGMHLQAWDIKNGAVLRNYISDSTGEGSCICMAREDYILCALKNKPFIFVWRIDKEQVHTRISCTGLVTAMVCHPEGVYCIGAISDKINIWEVSTGHLLAQQYRHYQPVSTLHFLKGGHHFVSGGKDGIVITWNLGKVLSQQRLLHIKDIPHAPKPLQKTHSNSGMTQFTGTLHVWSDHSMAVTSIASTGDDKAIHIFTASLDLTCKLYDFATGELLSTFLFNSPLSSISVNSSGLWLYVGCTTGQVITTPLFLPSVKQINKVSIHTDEKNKFISYFSEHKKPVTSLGLSANGDLLVSSSEDGTCIVWDIDSKQVLRTSKHKGPVTDMIILHEEQRVLKGKSHSSAAISPSSLVLKPFVKQLSYSRQEKDILVFEHMIEISTGTVNLLQENAMESLDHLCGDYVLKQFTFQPEQRLLLSNEDVAVDNTVEANALKQELREMKDVHKKLYTFAMEKLILS